MTTIRPATPDDALGVAAAHVRSWQVGYRGLLPDDLLDGLDVEQRASRYDFTSRLPGHYTLVADDDGVICGHVTVAEGTLGEGASDQSPRGEVFGFYVDPPRWGTGLGRLLMSAGRAELVAAGHRDAVLWMLEGNARAQRFYERDGWVLDGGRRADYANPGVHDVRFRRTLP